MKQRTSAMLTIGAMVLAGSAFTSLVLSQTTTKDAKPPEQASVGQSPTSQDDRRDERPRPPFRPGDGRRRGGGGMGPGGTGGFGGGGEGLGGGRGGGEWRRGDGRGEGPGNLDFDEPSDEEWKEITAFMDKHSPERLKRLDEIGDEQRQQSVKNMFAARYRAMEELKRDPELYALRLERMKLEDDVFALGWDLARDRFEKPEDRTKVVNELRPHLRKLVRNRLRERGHRLKQMEKELEQQRQKLREDQDEKRVEAAVEANLADIGEERWPRQFRATVRERRGEDAADPATPTPASPDEGK